jgi:hypothetical protein
MDAQVIAPRRRYTRRALLVLLLTLATPIGGYIVWSCRPLTANERFLVGTWQDGYIDRRMTFNENRCGTTVMNAARGTPVEYSFSWRCAGREVWIHQTSDPPLKALQSTFNRIVFRSHQEHWCNLRIIDPDTFRTFRDGPFVWRRVFPSTGAVAQDPK